MPFDGTMNHHPLYYRAADICGCRTTGRAGLLPISPSTFWRLVRAGKFPKPVKLGPNTTAWLADEVHAWAKACAASGAPQ